MSVHGRAILGLPFLTGFFAGVAYPLGGFGLVGPPFTNAYQSSDLSQTLPQETFTNLYRRDQGLTIDSDL